MMVAWASIEWWPSVCPTAAKWLIIDDMHGVVIVEAQHLLRIRCLVCFLTTTRCNEQRYHRRWHQ